MAQRRIWYGQSNAFVIPIKNSSVAFSLSWSLNSVEIFVNSTTINCKTLSTQSKIDYSNWKLLNEIKRKSDSMVSYLSSNNDRWHNRIVMDDKPSSVLF